MTYTNKHGNRITLQDNGLISITPKNESTRFYNLKEIIEALKTQGLLCECKEMEK